MSLVGWVLVAAAALLAARVALACLDRRQQAGAPRRPRRKGKPATPPPQTPCRGAVQMIDSLLTALALVFVIIRSFAVGAFWIPSGSMNDTLLISDRVIVNRFAYRFCSPRRGDIVVFKAPRAADTKGQEFIKRLIGLPGDRVHVEAATGQVFVNGTPLEETYTKERPNYDFPKIEGGGSRRYWQLSFKTDERYAEHVSVAVVDGIPQPRAEYPFFLGPIEGRDLVIPAGFYLFFGDNRRQSADGHEWGLVPADNLVGRAECIFWPIPRIRPLFSPW
jgi:signal peptidase I